MSLNLNLAQLVVGDIFVGELYHQFHKRLLFYKARRRANELGLPLLNYGCGVTFSEAAENSDINMDIVPRDVPNFQLIQPDGAVLPFADKSVVVYTSHVLEHLDHPEAMLKEFDRIGVEQYHAVPNPLVIHTWLVPQHKSIFFGKTRINNPLLPLTKLWEPLYLKYHEQRT